MTLQRKAVLSAEPGNQYILGSVSLQPASESVPRMPEFLRLPPPGQRCPYTGLSRSYMNELILPTDANGHRPPVRSFVLRKRGAQTGVRLIDAASLFAYIRRHEDHGDRTDNQNNQEGA